MKSSAAQGRDSNAAEPWRIERARRANTNVAEPDRSAARVYIVTRWLYIEEGEGFDIEGVFASEEAAQAFIDSEPIPGKRYRILEQEVRDA